MVDGGASKNNLLMQFQSDISNTNIVRSKSAEATALGAAYLAGLAVGFYKDENELLSLKQNEAPFTPKMSETERNTLINGWKKAVNCAKGWAE